MVAVAVDRRERRLLFGRVFLVCGEKSKRGEAHKSAFGSETARRKSLGCARVGRGKGRAGVEGGASGGGDEPAIAMGRDAGEETAPPNKLRGSRRKKERLAPLARGGRGAVCGGYPRAGASGGAHV